MNPLCNIGYTKPLKLDFMPGKITFTAEVMMNIQLCNGQG